MTKTISVGLGGYNFIFDENAYECLKNSLNLYESSIANGDKKALMDEIESKTAEILKSKTNAYGIVNISMVRDAIIQLGLPSGEDASRGQYNPDYSRAYERPVHKFFRDSDDKKIGGVCSGIAAYFDVDVLLIRILALVTLLCCGAGFWVYIITWLLAPSANTPAEKCQLRGIPCTAENLNRFSQFR